jgi:predicted Rossmann fold nucleotide-binding protein DprA/Smf involved in DNA uptake
VDESLIDYTMTVGKLAARAHRTLVSGGAKGIDQAAMRGALEAGGKVCGILADSLEKTTMNRENRNVLLDGQLVLISPYDPGAGFNVGNAMQRNKLIYALADASLVVSSDLNKGGTWTGAVEQLDKLKFVPVYVRSTGESSVGLDALRDRGAIPWPNPQDADAFEGVFDVAAPVPAQVPKAEPSLSFDEASSDAEKVSSVVVEVPPAIEVANELIRSPVFATEDEPVECVPETVSKVEESPGAKPQEVSPLVANAPTLADTLFAAVRDVMLRLLKAPMKDAEVAAALDISNAQAKAWLLRLLDEGVIEKKKKPSGYIVKQSRLF